MTNPLPSVNNLRCCELCSRWTGCQKHHFMSGRNRRLKTGERNEAGAKQRIIYLCPECHNDVHSIPADKFYEKYKMEKKYFLYTSKDAGDMVYEQYISDEKKAEVTAWSK